jgi:transposase-like protein
MAEHDKRRRRQFTAGFKRDAVELGIYDATLGNWVRQDRIEREGLTSDDKARLRQLEAENARLRMERDLAQTNHGLLGHRDIDTVSRYRCVDA